MKQKLLKLIAALALFWSSMFLTQSVSDLQLTKMVDNPTANVGGNVVFTVEAANNGPSDNTGISVQDLLPSGYTYVSHVATGTTYVPETGLWTIGNLANLGNSVLSITATVKSTGTYTNIAVISTSSGLSDPDIANNTATATVTPPLDSDGDGIPDSIDIDDDNDGIVDNIECVNLRATEGDFAPAITTITPNSRYSQTIDALTIDYTKTGSGNIISITESTSAATEFYASGTSVSYVYPALGTTQMMKLNIPAYVKFAVTDIDQPGEKTRVIIYDQNNVPYPDPSLFLRATAEGTSGTFPGIPTTFTDLGTNITKTAGAGFVDLTPISPASRATFYRPNMVYFDFGNDIVSRIDISNIGSAGGPGFLFNEISVCPDTDGDGIPDYLDLDSDNDGCLDAIEGSADITNPLLVNAGGTVTVGTGSTALNQNLCASGTCVNAQGLPQLSPLPTGYNNTTAQGFGGSKDASVNSCVCYNDAAAGIGVNTNHGITLLQRAGGTNTDWPMARKSAHTVLESNSKGFVITRMTTGQISAIVSPQEGMMVFDLTETCLKIFADGVWSCFTTPTCP